MLNAWDWTVTKVDPLVEATVSSTQGDLQDSHLTIYFLSEMIGSKCYHLPHQKNLWKHHNLL